RRFAPPRRQDTGRGTGPRIAPGSHNTRTGAATCSPAWSPRPLPFVRPQGDASMASSDPPKSPTADVRKLQFSGEAKTAEDALGERRYEDGVQIPALIEEAPWMARGERKDVLLAVYSEVCSGWRALTDVRFKLLGLLPAVSVLVLVALFTRKDAN